MQESRISPRREGKAGIRKWIDEWNKNPKPFA